MTRRLAHKSGDHVVTGVPPPPWSDKVSIWLGRTSHPRLARVAYKTRLRLVSWILFERWLTGSRFRTASRKVSSRPCEDYHRHSCHPVLEFGNNNNKTLERRIPIGITRVAQMRYFISTNSPTYSHPFIQILCPTSRSWVQAQTIKKLSQFYGSGRLITLFTVNSLEIPTPHLFNICFNIIRALKPKLVHGLASPNFMTGTLY